MNTPRQPTPGRPELVAVGRHRVSTGSIPAPKLAAQVGASLRIVPTAPTEEARPTPSNPELRLIYPDGLITAIPVVSGMVLDFGGAVQLGVHA